MTGWRYRLGLLVPLTLLHMGGWQCVRHTQGQGLLSSESHSAQVQPDLGQCVEQQWTGSRRAMTVVLLQDWHDASSGCQEGTSLQL